jgi:hypothetical protein
MGGGGVVIAAIVVTVLALGGSGNDRGSGKKQSEAAGPTTTITLQAGDISTESAGPPTSFSSEQAQQVLSTIRTYVNEAIVKPMRSGAPAGDLSTVFDQGTLARVTGADRGVMLQEGMPKVTGDLTVTAKPIAFVGLGDQGGKLVLVSAALQLAIDGKIAGSAAPLHVEQNGDFVFAPDASGAWKVTSYSMAITRSGGGIDVTTTLPPTTTTRARK